jgi:hypothetical protein
MLISFNTVYQLVRHVTVTCFAMMGSKRFRTKDLGIKKKKNILLHDSARPHAENFYQDDSGKNGL